MTVVPPYDTLLSASSKQQARPNLKAATWAGPCGTPLRRYKPGSGRACGSGDVSRSARLAGSTAIPAAYSGGKRFVLLKLLLTD